MATAGSKDVSSTFRDAYIQILCKLRQLRDCGTAVAGFDESMSDISVAGYSELAQKGNLFLN